MQESMYKFMKVGLVHFAAYPETIRGEGPILKTLEGIVEDDFFSTVEVTHIKVSIWGVPYPDVKKVRGKESQCLAWISRSIE